MAQTQDHLFRMFQHQGDCSLRQEPQSEPQSDPSASLKFKQWSRLDQELYDSSMSYFEDVLQDKSHSDKVILFLPEHEITPSLLAIMKSAVSTGAPEKFHNDIHHRPSNVTVEYSQKSGLSYPTNADSSNSSPVKASPGAAYKVAGFDFCRPPHMSYASKRRRRASSSLSSIGSDSGDSICENSAFSLSSSSSNSLSSDSSRPQPKRRNEVGVVGQLLILDDQSHLPTIDSVLEAPQGLSRVSVTVKNTRECACSGSVCGDPQCVGKSKVKGTVEAYIWQGDSIIGDFEY